MGSDERRARMRVRLERRNEPKLQNLKFLLRVKFQRLRM